VADGIAFQGCTNTAGAAGINLFLGLKCHVKGKVHPKTGYEGPERE